MPHRRRHSDGPADPIGVAQCVLSAVGFGALAIFAKSAFDAGLDPLTLLFVRFTVCALVFGLVVGVRTELRADLLRAGSRAIALGFALGAVGYAAQAGLFFAALERIDASLLALLLYTYPAWVILGAFVLGLERPTRRRLTALAIAWTGLGILLAGAASGRVDAVGVALGVMTALVYAGYILVSDRAGLRIAPLALTTLVCGGAACSIGAAGVVTGSLQTDITSEGWMWIGLIALVSTALPIALFFAGLARVGPSSTAILMSIDPVVTVLLAYLVLDEVLSGTQLVGAALVVGAALLIASPLRSPAVPPD